MRAAIGNLLPQLRAARPDLFGELSAADVRWAREMVVTRAFRAEILNHEGGACGVLCPLLDLRNHADGAAEATPRASDGYVRLCAPGIDVGAEIVTNYGEVSNADHLMSHGFALRGSTHETFALSVAGGVFDIREAGGDDQFPWGLYESFASSPEVILDGSRARITGVPAECGPRAVKTGDARAVLTAILRACRAAVRPFDATCRRDKALLAPPGPGGLGRNLPARPMENTERRGPRPRGRPPTAEEEDAAGRNAVEKTGAAPPTPSKTQPGLLIAPSSARAA